MESLLSKELYLMKNVLALCMGQYGNYREKHNRAPGRASLLLYCIREAPGSNLGRNTTILKDLVVILSPSRWMRENVLN
jgi:hypothetical protein